MSLISPSVYREHDPGTSLGDDSLQRLIDANEDYMVRMLGPHSRVGSPAIVTGYGSGKRVLWPPTPVGTMVSVEETPNETDPWTALAASDYRVLDGGMGVERLNATTGWGYRVRLTYVTRDDLARRIVALLDLVGTDVAHGVASGGIASRTMGSWSESYGTGDGGRDAAKAKIIERLRNGAIVFA